MSERRYADGYRKLRKADEPRRIAYDVLHEVALRARLRTSFAEGFAPGTARRSLLRSGCCLHLGARPRHAARDWPP